jgi:hypothetical protein
VTSFETAPKPLLVLATPAERTLLEWLGAKVTRQMMEELSLNDYGEDGPGHLAGILAQLGPKPPLGLLPWCPREVLELGRWEDPDRAYTNQPPSRERGHLKRLLACVILLRNGAYVSGRDALSEDDLFLQTSAASLNRFTRSAIAIEVSQRALGFTLWLFQVQPHPGLRAFIAFCSLVLASAMGFGEATEQEIIQICDWVDDEEIQCREVLGDDVDTDRWLIGLNSHEKRRGEEWALLAKNFLHARKGFSEDVSLRLHQFSDRLEGNSMVGERR